MVTDLQKSYKAQLDYTVAMQRAIEYHVRGEVVPNDILIRCPYHASLLNNSLGDTLDTVPRSRYNAVCDEVTKLEAKVKTHLELFKKELNKLIEGKNNAA